MDDAFADPELMEILAAIEHERWSGWMRWMFDNWTEVRKTLRPSCQTSTSAGPLQGTSEPFEPASMTSRISSGVIPRSTIAFLRAPATLTW
jgi:hypothetical protein